MNKIQIDDFCKSQNLGKLAKLDPKEITQIHATLKQNQCFGYWHVHPDKVVQVQRFSKNFTRKNKKKYGHTGARTLDIRVISTTL